MLFICCNFFLSFTIDSTVSFLRLSKDTNLASRVAGVVVESGTPNPDISKGNSIALFHFWKGEHLSG